VLPLLQVIVANEIQKNQNPSKFLRIHTRNLANASYWPSLIHTSASSDVLLIYCLKPNVVSSWLVAGDVFVILLILTHYVIHGILDRRCLSCTIE